MFFDVDMKLYINKRMGLEWLGNVKELKGHEFTHGHWEREPIKPTKCDVALLP